MSGECISEEPCYICLSNESAHDHDALIRPCPCPRNVHRRCLARWQLKQAGKPEETSCRFCQHTIGDDWRNVLTPLYLRPYMSYMRPTLGITFNGEQYDICVELNTTTLPKFLEAVRLACKFPPEHEFDMRFVCQDPFHGGDIAFESINAFNAAVYCATIAAAKREHKLFTMSEPPPPLPPLPPPPPAPATAAMRLYCALKNWLWNKI